MIKKAIRIALTILAITAFIGSISSCASTKYGKKGYECPNKM